MLPGADTAACSPSVWGWPWVRPLSILRLDIADRAVVRVAGEGRYVQVFDVLFDVLLAILLDILLK